MTDQHSRRLHRASALNQHTTMIVKRNPTHEPDLVSSRRGGSRSWSPRRRCSRAKAIGCTVPRGTTQVSPAANISTILWQLTLGIRFSAERLTCQRIRNRPDHPNVTLTMLSCGFASGSLSATDRYERKVIAMKTQRLTDSMRLVGAIAVLFAVLGAGTAWGATLIVTNTSDSGAGSLRQALLSANSTVNVPDVINFNIAGAAAQYSDTAASRETLRPVVTWKAERLSIAAKASLA